MAYAHCLLGARNEDLATLFGVKRQTIDNWIKTYPEFKEAILKGRDEADAIVVQRLYARAKGYSHPEEKVFCNQGEIITHTTTKHYPPDPTSIIFWLKNRQPMLWRDKHDLNVGLEQDAIERILSLFPKDYADKIRSELAKMN